MQIRNTAIFSLPHDHAYLEQHRIGGGEPFGAHLLRVAAGARAVLLQRDLEELGAARLNLR